MGLMEKLVRQCRRPTGWLGGLTGRGMNLGHARVRRWGLSHLSIAPGAMILDLGCGGGRNVKVLAGLAPQGRVLGLDYSPAMVRLAGRVNRSLIRAGRAAIVQGAVSALPFADRTFDLATAFETCYFWPDLVADLREIARVLKLGGQLLLVNEAYRHPRFEKRNARWVEWAKMNIHAPEEYGRFLAEAGYRVVRLAEAPEKNWIAVLAKKG